MASCDTCRKPGHCCSGFTLNFYFNRETWQEEATEILKKNNLEFIVPVRIAQGWLEQGRTGVVFDCTRLGADGRCTDYENRPELCKIYQPGQDGLCIEHVEAFKDIPIIVAKEL